MNWPSILLVLTLSAAHAFSGARDLAITVDFCRGPDRSAEVVAGDPAVILVEAANTGADAVSLVVPRVDGSDVRLADPPVQVHVRGPRELEFRRVRPIRLDPDGFVGGGRIQFDTLQPGATRSYRLLPSWWHWEGQRFKGIGDWAFSEPGVYEVKLIGSVLATPKVGDGYVDREGADRKFFTTDPLSIQVVLPNAEHDLKALNDLMRLNEKWRLYAPWLCFGLPEELIAFRERHPESRYFKFTEFAVLHGDFAAARRVGDREVLLAVYDEVDELVARAKREGWPAGWIATGEELRLRMWPGVRRDRPRPDPVSGEAERGADAQ